MLVQNLNLMPPTKLLTYFAGEDGVGQKPFYDFFARHKKKVQLGYEKIPFHFFQKKILNSLSLLFLSNEFRYVDKK